MFKLDEMSNANSCLNRAREDEMIFVLLGRDVAAAATIRFWIDERIRLGKNKRTDEQIVHAERCADIIDSSQEKPCPGPPKCRIIAKHRHMPTCIAVDSETVAFDTSKG